jgi:hypothetical protein
MLSALLPFSPFTSDQHGHNVAVQSMDAAQDQDPAVTSACMTAIIHDIPMFP